MTFLVAAVEVERDAEGIEDAILPSETETHRKNAACSLFRQLRIYLQHHGIYLQNFVFLQENMYRVTTHMLHPK